MSYDNLEQLRQLLLELHYDLLDESEAQPLRRAIESDPVVAAEWARTRRLAEQISDAARLHTVDLPGTFPSTMPIDALDRELDRSGRSSDSSSATLPSEADAAVSLQQGVGERGTGEVKRNRASSLTPWSTVSRFRSLVTSGAVAAIAAVLGMLLLGSWYLERLPERPAASIRLQASQIPDSLAQSDHEFRVLTSRVDQSSVAGRFPVTPALLSFSVLARETTLFSGTARTNDDGTARIVLPESLIIPPEAKLRVTAEPVAEPSGDATVASSLEMPLAPTRCVTYLTVDRPVYRPGETVFFRSLTLLRRSLKYGSEFPVRYELVDPDGAVVPGGFVEGVTRRGVGNGAIVLPAEASAGSYSLIAKSLDGFFPDERCEFEVHAYRIPVFKKELRFRHRSYGPGDTVQADVSAARATGEPLGNAAARVEAEIDGGVIHRSVTRLSNEGTGQLEFTLPESLVGGRGELRVTLESDGTEETIAEAIPLRSGQVSVQFYPEGGYLVAGLENRVYVSARDGLGLPVRVEGKLVDRAGEVVAEVVTQSDGLGDFSFRPEQARGYRLEVATPRDVDVDAIFPEAVEGLPVMETGAGVFASDQPITMVLRSQQARSVLVRAVSRGRQVGETVASLGAGDNSIELSVDPETAGVVRVTVLDPGVTPPRPIVERLVYRRSPRRLDMKIQADGATMQGSPGDHVRLTIQARDENGQPVEAVLGVAVVDEAVRSLDQRDRPSMRTQFLLLSEVEHPEQLEQADFYLSEGPDAAKALDRLLGTQGWRRFVDAIPESTRGELREQLIRLLELDGDPSAEPAPVDNANRFASQWLRYQQQLDDALRQLLAELRFLAIVVLAIWLVVYAWLRRTALSKLVTCLLMAFASLAMYGCGASHEGMVMSSAERQPPSTAVEAGRAPEAIASARDADDSAAADAGVQGAASETPARLIDWLDAEKAAWLLRIAGKEENGTTSAAEVGDRTRVTPQELRRLMEARGMDAQTFADELIESLQFPVRQYAHLRSASQSSATGDYAETLYWHPLLVTDPSGKATIEFDLPDSETTFRVHIDGHTAQGRIGAASAEIVSRPR